MKYPVMLILISILFYGACAQGYLIRSDNPNEKEVWIGNKKYGPFPDAYSLNFAENAPDFGFVYRWDGKMYVNINDNISGPYEKAGYLYFYGSGSDYIYYVQQKDDDGFIRYYIIRNGKEYGPYIEVRDLYIGEWKHHYCLAYQDDQGYGVDIDGHSYEYYDELGYPKFDPTGAYFCFPYSDHGSWYIKSTFSSEGPFESIQDIYWDSNNFKVLYNNVYSMNLQ